jgi:hypothetical protein
VSTVPRESDLADQRQGLVLAAHLAAWSLAVTTFPLWIVYGAPVG